MAENPMDSMMWTVAEALERAAKEVEPSLGAVLRSLDPTSEWYTEALISHSQSCLVALLQKAGTSELSEIAESIDRLQASGSDSDPLVSDWRALAAIAAARRGPTAATQALRTRNGKGAAVLRILSRSSVSLTRSQIASELYASFETRDDSTLSHILRDLQDADLIRRHSAGRETVVEITGYGRELTRNQNLVRAEPKRTDHCAFAGAFADIFPPLRNAS